jgi:hypothetical protein
MNLPSRSACLEAVLQVARSARLCAGSTPGDERYTLASDTVLRMMARAQSHYERCRKGHAPTERNVRLVATAVAEARAVATLLQGGLSYDSYDLDRLAGKVERAVARCALPAVSAPA